MKVCDNAGNCTEKNIYFKIDKEQPRILYDGIISNNYYGFTCQSGLSGINRFFGSDSNGNSVNASRYNINYINSQFITRNDSGYWLDGNGDIYLTCSSKTIIYSSTPNDVVYDYINATYSINNKSGSTWYKWDCTRAGVSGQKFIYTTTSANPYSQHCGLNASGKTSSSCANGFSEISGTNKCYSFENYVPY